MDIVGRIRIWFVIALILLLPGVIALIFWGLKPGIDFSGGTLLELNFPKTKTVSQALVENTLKPLKLEDLKIQMTGPNSVLIRIKPIDKAGVDNIEKALGKGISSPKEVRLETVGPVVSKNLTQKAVISVIVASIAIILYIALAFRKVPKPTNSFQFGVAAVVALLHDLLFVCGIFAILGHFFIIEVDALFITALLTVMGFSVHDTIVVFDRIRENLKQYSGLSFKEIVNKSILQTLIRSLNTSITVLLVLLSLYIFGGEAIKNFVLALLVGIFIGTYSSIFIASMLLVVWKNWAEKRSLKRA